MGKSSAKIVKKPVSSSDSESSSSVEPVKLSKRVRAGSNVSAKSDASSTKAAHKKAVAAPVKKVIAKKESSSDDSSSEDVKPVSKKVVAALP